MPNKYHTVYLTIIGVLVVTLGWGLSSWPSNSPEVDRLANIVVIPFSAGASTIASTRLTNGVIRKLEGSGAVKLAQPPPDAGAVDINDLFKFDEDTLRLFGSVSGSDEKLRVSVIIFDSRPNGLIWTDEYVTNIYDLNYVAEEISRRAVSIASH